MGAKPGHEKRGGRAKGTKNKLTIGRAKEEFDKKHGKEKFDPYDKLEIIAKQFLAAAANEYERKPKPNIKRGDEYLDRAARILRDMVPYKKPKLVAAKLSGDKKAPLFDLSGLSDNELAFLRKTVLKAQPIEDEDGEGED
jgi:hypothetical protein